MYIWLFFQIWDLLRIPTPAVCQSVYIVPFIPPVMMSIIVKDCEGDDNSTVVVSPNSMYVDTCYKGSIGKNTHRSI